MEYSASIPAFVFGSRHFPALVVDRPAELVPLPGQDELLLGRDRRLGLGGDLRAVGSKAREAVLDRAVVEPRLPGTVHGRLHPADVVLAPVVDGGRQPLLRGELLCIRVVADPGDARLLGVDPRGRSVDVLPDHVGSGCNERLGRRGLLRRRDPCVRPDELHLRTRVRRLGAEREGVDVPHDLGDAVGHHVADDALLGRGAGRHAREVDRVFGCAEVLGLVRLELLPCRLLEDDLRVLLPELAVDPEFEHAERRGEDHVVAVACETGHDLRHRRVAEHVLLVGGLHLAAERLLNGESSGIVRLRPAAVVVWAGIDPGNLECRLLLARLRRRQPGQRRSRQHQARDQRAQHELPLLHE
jgi:hypothetical protein